MIITHKVDYAFEQPIEKIHYFSPAYNNSIVVIGTKRIGEDYLGHYDQQGKLVFSYDFQDLVDTLVTPNNTTAIVLKVEEGLIYQFNLRTQQLKKFRHFYMVDVSCQVSLDFFSETNLICIQENGDHDNHKIMMTYYPFPFEMERFLNQHPPKYSCQFISPENVWSPTFLVRKVNSHSKYVWYQTLHQDVFKLRMVELVTSQGNLRELYQEVTIRMNSLFEPYSLDTMGAAIVELWEFQPDVMLLFCSTSKNEKGAINLKTNVVNNTFLWNTKLRTIRQSHFTLPPQRQDLQVDVLGSPQLSMFRTFYYENGKAVKAPAYFVNNSTERIIKEETYICSHLQKYKVYECDQNTLVEGVFSNLNVKTLTLRTMSLCDRKEMSLFLLNQMFDKPKSCSEQWDFQILTDIFKMLDYSEYN